MNNGNISIYIISRGREGFSPKLYGHIKILKIMKVTLEWLQQLSNKEQFSAGKSETMLKNRISLFQWQMWHKVYACRDSTPKLWVNYRQTN